MADFQNTAQGLAALGRGGDSTLVHMNPEEVAGLQNLAASNGTSLTTNPNTGMPEAFNLRGLLPMVAGVGINAAFPGLGPLMTGVLVGGATAVLEGDVMSGLGAGLGAYGGASLGASLSEAAGAVPAGGTTAGLNEAAINQSLVSANPTIAAGPAGPNMTGFSSTAGGGTMGITPAANTVTSNYPSAFQNTTNPSSNILGQGKIPQANLQPASARGYQYKPNEIAGRAADNAIYRDYTGVGGYTPAVQPSVANAANSTIPPHLRQTGVDQARNNAGITDALTVRDINAVNNSPTINSVSDNLSQQGQGLKNVVTDYSATRDAMGLTDGEMFMKFGLPVAGGIAGGLEESDFQDDPVDMAQFEDRRFRGPDGQLNVEGQTGLNLNNPFGYTAGGYGYAEGGEVERNQRARQGMKDALARNKGTAYAQPTFNSVSTPVSTYNPVSTPVSTSNINVGGFRSTPSNLTGGVGSLNVNSGAIGQSPNQALRDTKFKMLNGYEVPLDFTPATERQGNVFSGYTPATQASHTYNSASKQWEKSKPIQPTFRIGGDNGSTLGAYIAPFSGYGGPEAGIAQFAEGGYLGGGDVNVQGDGMSDDIPANIDNEQPAALSEGEFVVPADVVSHIGNGSSEAGAKEFYGMMDRVRMARTGRKKQSPEIDPERFMPA